MVMYLCVRDIDFASFCDFSFGFRNYYSESVVSFIFHFIGVINIRLILLTR